MGTRLSPAGVVQLAGLAASREWIDLDLCIAASEDKVERCNVGHLCDKAIDAFCGQSVVTSPKACFQGADVEPGGPRILEEKCTATDARLFKIERGRSA